MAPSLCEEPESTKARLAAASRGPRQGSGQANWTQTQFTARHVLIPATRKIERVWRQVGGRGAGKELNILIRRQRQRSGPKPLHQESSIYSSKSSVNTSGPASTARKIIPTNRQYLIDKIFFD
ncbi:hypothetical protein ACOMHN_009811 [Nucella lapillus]